jgi:HptB-dependent secretion and biofilm anti anti-sigma factor
MSDIVTVRLPARFDYAYHRQFSESYQQYVDDKQVKELVLDFSQVGYIDSWALGMMVLLQKRCSTEGKKTTIKGARGATLEILKMANMQVIFDFI